MNIRAEAQEDVPAIEQVTLIAFESKPYSDQTEHLIVNALHTGRQPLYYQRFGFKTYPGLSYDGAPSPEFFMALPFYDDLLQGKVEFHQAFYVRAE